MTDGTIEARKFLSAMARTGERFATEHLVAILTGKETDSVLRFGHDKLPTFGVGKEHGATAWRSVARQLYAAGVISLDITRHGRWTITDLGRDVLKGRERVEIRAAAMARHKGKARGKASVEPVLSDPEAGLLRRLKDLRTQLAKSQQVPAYVVFPDRTLIEMARARPGDLDALRLVSGVGEAKLARYGTAFLAAIASDGT